MNICEPNLLSLTPTVVLLSDSKAYESPHRVIDVNKISYWKV